MTEDYSKLPIQDLIQRFVYGATRLGSGYLSALKMDRDSPEGQRLRTEIKACGKELALRKPIDEIRPLFAPEHSKIT
jgi:hypothetical protein